MKFWKYIPFLLLLTLTACRSTQTGLKPTEAGKERSEQVFISKVVTNGQRADCVTAKIEMELEASGKDLSVSGKLRMKRDEVIQVSLTLLGFEVGRLEFTPQQVLVLDRINRQFVRTDYSGLDFLQQANLDFYSLQSLFWNELFIPGQREIGESWTRYNFEDQDRHALLTLNDAPKLKYVFQTQKSPVLLNQVTVEGKNVGDRVKLVWTYDRFVNLDQRYFPSQMRCQVSGLDKPLGFSLSLSRLDNDDRWEKQTRVSSRYRERNAEDIFRQLMDN